MATQERWHLAVEGRAFEIVLTHAGLGREIVWLADGEEIARKRTSDEKVVLAGGDAGAVGVRLPAFLGPARRVTHFAPSGSESSDAATQAHLGVGGTDFDPAPGSAAARREAWIRAHPRQYGARRVAAAVAGVVVPLLLLWLLARYALPAIPWPDWDLPLPDLPSLPLPDIPWPDLSLPDWSLPGWLEPVRDALKFVGPVLLAGGIAYAEVKRRRDQDARKQAGRAGGPIGDEDR
ncbi:hypothetical protein KUV85_06925 [Nocardioides panacisoli]|uniref:hypothetical protein n=1 Tax=Nocardioides panacisoli TaxID=627624 RepID=UPI001C629561|nr:hypothetical protein [Nocardioides panacisoli]QYJ05407.1 hypothetical protein KUV85_06925 [Nocardioides panacisoli]